MADGVVNCSAAAAIGAEFQVWVSATATVPTHYDYVYWDASSASSLSRCDSHLNTSSFTSTVYPVAGDTYQILVGVSTWGVDPTDKQAAFRIARYRTIRTCEIVGPACQ